MILRFPNLSADVRALLIIVVGLLLGLLLNALYERFRR